jgi:DNA-binding NtrC family response regulator
MSDESLLSGRRVLIVEDEVIVAWALEAMLADIGCMIVGPAARVNQALAMIEMELIDVALLDINLNGEKSYPVADALAARGVPFVFSTGYRQDRMPDGYQQFPLLQKPFSGEELAEALAKLLVQKVPKDARKPRRRRKKDG